jgi:aspartate beta-hydroxylase
MVNMPLQNELHQESADPLELAESALADLVARFPASDLTRMRGLLDNISGRSTPSFHPHQSSEEMPLHFPGLPNEPFLNTDLFPEVSELTSAYDVIMAETAGLLDGTLQPKHFGDEWRPRRQNEAAAEPAWRKWKKFMFYDGGASVRLDDNCSACPATSQLIDRIVGGYADFVTAGVLVQEGRMTLKPHVDNFNLYVSLFMPLVVPGPCGVAAAGERRMLEAGKCVAFDNSFLHYSWNDSDRPRTVLALYRLTPRVTPTEAAAWVYLKKTYGRLFLRAARKAAH